MCWFSELVDSIDPREGMMCEEDRVDLMPWMVEIRILWDPSIMLSNRFFTEVWAIAPDPKLLL